jgi:hypothetical protein
VSCAPPDFRPPIDPGAPDAALLRALEQAAAQGYAKGLADERRRCTQHAHRLALRAFSAPVEYPAVLATAEAISGGKAAP